MTVQSLGGAKYYVSFVDDFSKKEFVFPIRNKSDVFSKFIEFKKLVENQTEKTIKVFRSDNGTEFVNKQFQQFFIANGIKHEKTAPYSPQQNVVAERMNRTLVEKVRCMLFDSGLSKQFLAEALCTAANIVNVLPVKANDNKSPDEIWFQKKPDIKNMKVFGCRVMSLIPQEKRKKLDEKSVECFFLGIAQDAKAYRLYDKKTKKVINYDS